MTNGPQDASDFKPSKSVSKLTPKTPSTPLTPEVALKPADYKYLVELVQSPEHTQLLVQAKQLRYVTRDYVVRSKRREPYK